MDKSDSSWDRLYFTDLVTIINQLATRKDVEEISREAPKNYTPKKSEPKTDPLYSDGIGSGIR